MPVPSTIDDLSTTAASNSPSGSDQRSQADDYLRAHAAILKQLATDLGDSSSATKGDAQVAVKNTATGSVATTQHEVNQRVVNVFDFLSSSQKADVISGGFSIDCRAAVQAAVDAAIAGGVKRIYAPGKGYLINAVASSDTKENGILFAFNEINFNPANQIVFEGDGMGTVFRCGTTDMVMFRISRNCVILRNLTIDGNSLADTWGVGIVPESMTQTSTQVSQSFIDLDNVGRVNLTEGIVIQPGPRVSGSDSGCFYHNITGGISNNNTRHVYTKKGSTWATDANRATRTNFKGQRLTRGNVGYYLEVGSEILIESNEELIDDGTSPLATPTARWVSADCSNIRFVGGYSESCSASFDGAANNVSSYGYIPASGSDTDWLTYVSSYDDGTSDSRSFTPVLVSSGGGAEGASTSTGKVSRLGKICHFTCQVSAAKGTLSAGTLSITGLPFVADTAWTGASFEFIPVPHWAGMTFTANVSGLTARISGATLDILKLHTAGGSAAGLTLAECADPVTFTVQGWYKTA